MNGVRTSVGFLLETAWVEQLRDVGLVIGWRASVENDVGTSVGLWLVTAWVEWRHDVGQAGDPWSRTGLGRRSGFVWQQRGSNGVRPLVGLSVGGSMGLLVGALVGDSVGLLVRALAENGVRTLVGLSVGYRVGLLVGALFGVSVGDGPGLSVRASVLKKLLTYEEERYG